MPSRSIWSSTSTTPPLRASGGYTGIAVLTGNGASADAGAAADVGERGHPSGRAHLDISRRAWLAWQTVTVEHPDVLKADPDAARTLKVLATVDNAPLEVVAARKGLDARVVDRFRTAFTTS